MVLDRVLDAALDLEPVPIEVGQTNAIADQSSGPCNARRAPKVGGIVAQQRCAKVGRRRCPRGLRGNADHCGCSRNCSRRGLAQRPLGETSGRPARPSEPASQETCRRCRPFACRESARHGIPSWRRVNDTARARGRLVTARLRANTEPALCNDRFAICRAHARRLSLRRWPRRQRSIRRR